MMWFIYTYTPNNIAKKSLRLFDVTLSKYQRPRTSSKATKKGSTILFLEIILRPKYRNPTQLPGEGIHLKHTVSIVWCP